MYKDPVAGGNRGVTKARQKITMVGAAKQEREQREI